MKNSWRIKKIKDVLSIQNGYAFDSKLFTDSEGIPLIRIRDIKKGVKTDTKFKGKYDKKYEVKTGDFLIGMDGEFGCYEWKGGVALLNQRVCRLQNFSADIYPRFLFYGINKYLKAIEDVTAFVTVKHISSKKIEDIEIPLPSFEDQKRIVKILDQADTLRQKRKQAIKLLDNYLKSVFLEMFGDPVKNTKSWKVNNLGKICDVRDGTHDSPKYHSVGFPLVTSKNIKNGFIDFSEVNLISEKDLISINKRSLVEDGDILMPMIGTIGNPIIVKKNRDFAIKNVALIKCRPDIICNIYLKSLLDSNYFTNYISKKSRGGTQKFLSLSDIRNVAILLPDIGVQKKYSQLVEKIDLTKQKMIAQSEELETQFQALMQKAFKGEL